MKITQDNIKIELQNESEIQDFWNVIEFALDWQDYAVKNNKSKMTDSELELAKKLAEATNWLN